VGVTATVAQPRDVTVAAVRRHLRPAVDRLSKGLICRLTGYESAVFGVSVPGLVAVAVWAIGFVVGVSALLTGHAGVAVVALLVAVMAPWFGAAWVSHARRRAYNVARYLHMHRGAQGCHLSGAQSFGLDRCGSHLNGVVPP
jgi:Flp pilus assembly protein TadB